MHVLYETLSPLSMKFPFQTVKISLSKLSKSPFQNCQNFLFKLSKFSFPNCQNFPFKTVKISLFKLSKFPFPNCRNFHFQTVKTSYHMHYLHIFLSLTIQKKKTQHNFKKKIIEKNCPAKLEKSNDLWTQELINLPSDRKQKKTSRKQLKK